MPPGEGSGTSPFSLTIGPANVIQSTDPAILASIVLPADQCTLRVTQNSISANGAGIVYVLTSLGPTAPAIGQFSGSQVSGTCASQGEVELFSDPGDQGQTYLGTAGCNAGAWSLQLPTAPAAGQHLTATITVSGWTSPFSAPYPVP